MNVYLNLKLKTKLISAFMLIAIIMGFVGYYGLSNVSKMNDRVDYMYAGIAIPINDVLNAQVNYTLMRVSIRDLYIAQTADEKKKIADSYQAAKVSIETAIAKYKASELTDIDREALQPFDAAWSAYTKTYEKAIEAGVSQRNADLLGLITGDLRTQGDTLRDVLNKIVAANLKDAETSNKESSSLYKSSRNITIGVVILAVLLSMGLGYLIAQLIARPLNRVVSLVAKVANGDLSDHIDINTKDEVGMLATSINHMIENLRGTIGNILNSSQSVAAAAEQISATTQEIASGSASQANAAQTINELFRELSVVIHSVAQNTEEASELSNNTVQVAKAGSEVIQSSMRSMSEVSTKMSRLESDSQKVGDIIEVIEDIADQTNLLALNAAIEAARAGEQGRGFAVVADEVRKLAERSGEATKQITVIIKGMQENTRQSVAAVQESAALSKQTGESFQQIALMVNEAGEKVSEIAAASEEQSAQTSTVLISVENISTVTEESAASSEETAATALSLAQLAEDLQQSVAIFKIK
ncbi:methyl-accepting chemotaxis protein [Paenibacillus whitsoniae]|uniref:Methyl-accepting chemotaxis protein n=1 Tax=Paenibacillus whitsoniae TaxID=2496558 RepID=A0A3S0BYW2_9BACL|nr:methyl-accepting chemotaxis protein [Paenibacillus whitsoniae]RTE11385.1 methyl-accepting chemotaxis protein [Paenibacillus whitsoniae]